jgi:Ser/Thr protein kinase RdoA (MazF antagonist)
MENPDGNAQLDIVEQKWTPIDLDEAEGVLSQLEEPLHAHELGAQSLRPTAAAAMIQTDQRLVFIKRYPRGIRSSAGIAAYHHFAAHVRSRGIPTPRFLSFAERDCGTGSIFGTDSAYATVLERSGNFYEVSLLAAGADRYVSALTWDPPQSLEEARNLGSFMARLSLAASDFKHPEMEPNGLSNRFSVFFHSDIDAAIEAWLERNPVVKEYLGRTQRDLHSELEAHRSFAGRLAHNGYGLLKPCWTHGDPHISNFMWSGSAPSAVIDFGLADLNTALFDVAMTIERNCIQWVRIMGGERDACRPDMARAILTGYQKVRPLSDREKALLPDVVALCQAQAGLNWITYYAALRSEEDRSDGVHQREHDEEFLSNASWCYDTCFVSHTQWFSSDEGRAFVRESFDFDR